MFTRLLSSCVGCSIHTYGMQPCTRIDVDTYMNKETNKHIVQIMQSRLRTTLFEATVLTRHLEIS